MATEQQIRTIERMRAECYSYREIGEAVGLSGAMCSYIVNGRKS